MKRKKILSELLAENIISNDEFIMRLNGHRFLKKEGTTLELGPPIKEIEKGGEMEKDKGEMEEDLTW